MIADLALDNLRLFNLQISIVVWVLVASAVPSIEQIFKNL